MLIRWCHNTDGVNTTTNGVASLVACAVPRTSAITYSERHEPCQVETHSLDHVLDKAAAASELLTNFNDKNAIPSSMMLCNLCHRYPNFGTNLAGNLPLLHHADQDALLRDIELRTVSQDQRCCVQVNCFPNMSTADSLCCWYQIPIGSFAAVM